MKDNNLSGGNLFSGIIELNKTIHEPARIAILCLLSSVVRPPSAAETQIYLINSTIPGMLII